MREKIIHKAADMFITLGFKSVTMDDIATAMGISKKTIYANFKNKTDLVKEATLALFHVISHGIDCISDQDNNPIEELYAIKKFVMMHLKDERSSPQYQLQKYYPEIYMDLRAKEYQYLGKMVRDSLQDGINSGLFRAGIDLEFVSRLHINGMRGIRDIEIFPIEQFKIEELFENYLDYHLRAIITPKGLETLTLFKSTI